jgi:FixJ family two-component response regulator
VLDITGGNGIQAAGIAVECEIAMDGSLPNEDVPVIYVVDDDSSVRSAMDSLIRSLGFRAQTFASARDFLECKPAGTGCLILDVHLPGLNGLDLQRELARADFRLPVIFVTGWPDVPTSVRAMKAGAVEFLAKPLQEEELVSAIREAVERDRAAKHAAQSEQSELETAARIQQGLMALKIPQPSYATVCGRNLPCAAVGGDFFSAVTVDEEVTVAIADVSGKGIAAAVMASLLQGMIHEAVSARVPLGDIARGVNEFFCVRDLCAKYATFVIIALRPSGDLEYINCGHIPPLIASRAGVVERLPEFNTTVGLIASAKFLSSSVRLRPGERILLVTDGVTEAEGPAGEFFGNERLEDFAAKGMSPDDLIAQVQVFCAGRPMSDDCTVVGLFFAGNGSRD